MRVLALDGALGDFTVAVYEGGTVRSRASRPPQRALEEGLSAVAEALSDATLDGPALERIAVGIGPGSFTGLRIAVSYAKSLATAWRVPLSGISLFDALDFNVDRHPRLTVVSARRGVVSVRYTDGGPSWRASGQSSAVLDDLLRRVDGTPFWVVNAPEDVLGALAERVEFVRTAQSPTPPVAAIAAIATQRAPAASPHEVRADYGELLPARPPAPR